ncbi:hypothetical protein [Lewinella cohaerens]|uniref:hypothetical protein n=1 Tax=Lewinella cohaerens TaxID=70995 RepID=UPI00036BEABC|nr:hypothetical protein [Lewinella cohaerens]
MTTNTSSPTPTPTPLPPKQDSSKQRLIAIAAVVIVVLLAVNAWLLFKYTQADKAQETLTTQLDESTKLQEELNDQYYEAKAELESMRSNNEELNAMIEQQQQELLASKDRIASMIRKGGDGSAARAEINQLKQQLNGYVAELNQLREQNALLTDENQQLAEQRDNLQTDLSSTRQTNESLNQERALLVSEKQQLASTNSSLSRKVSQASTIKVAGLEAVGQKIRRSGKPVTRQDANNVERISVSFVTTVNEITEPGTEEFVVRIINPQGETLAMEQMGSGVFTNQGTGEAMRYTLKDDISYDRNENALQFIWNPGQQFASGNYKIEIYNKGFLAGSTTMRLK